MRSPLTRSRHLTLTLLLLAIAAQPLPAQVSLQPTQVFPIPEQHSYIIGLEIPTTQSNEGRRLFLYTTQETYSSFLPFNAQQGWQKEFDLTPFNVNLYEDSSAAVNPANPNLYYFTGGLSLNRSIRFQQGPIAVTANQRIGDLRYVPQNIVLRAPTTPGGPVEVFYTVSGYNMEGITGETPGIYRHGNADQMPWTNSTSIAASSGVGALRFGPDGLLNVIDTQNQNITRYNPDTLAYVSEFALGNTHTDRNAFVITPNGFVLTTFADSAAGAIYSYATGQFIGNYGLDTTVNPGTGYGGKTSMTLNPDNGLVYVLTANSAGESLFVYHTVDLMDPAIGTINILQPGDARATPFETSSLHYLSLASGTATQSGVISGSGAVSKKDFGTLVLSASNTYTGGTTVDNGTLIAAFTGAKGTFADHSTVTVNYWGTLAVDGESLGSGPGTTAVVLNRGILTSTSTTGQATTLRDVTMTGGLITRSDNGRFILDGSLTVIPSITPAWIDADLELRNVTFNVPETTDHEREIEALTVTSTLSGSGSLVKNGDGVLLFSGTGSYTGDTTVNSGLLIFGEHITVSSSVTVAQGAHFRRYGGLTIASDQTLRGSGTVANMIHLASGGHVAPGDSLGTLNVTAHMVWNGGATYEWEINNAASPSTTAGTNYDHLFVASTLTINATSGDKFILKLTSLLANNTAGDAINFNNGVDSSYTIASADGGIFGFDANAFTINADGFTNNLNGGSWNLSFGNSNRDLNLNFAAAAVPEPSTYAAIFGLTALGFAAWRKRKNPNVT